MQILIQEYSDVERNEENRDIHGRIERFMV